MDTPKKLTRAQVVEMIEAYKTKRNLKSPLEANTESIYSWFSREVLFFFLEENGFMATRNEAGEILSFTVPSAAAFSGMRVYQAAHSKSYAAPRPLPGSVANTVEYLGYNNVVIVATRASVIGELSAEQQARGIQYYHVDIVDDNEETAAMGPDMTARDYATLCPPNCNHIAADMAGTQYKTYCATCK